MYDQNKSNLTGKNKCSICGKEGNCCTSKNTDCINRTKITQLVKAGVLPVVRKDIAALAKRVDCMNIIKVTPIQPEREKKLYMEGQ